MAAEPYGSGHINETFVVTTSRDGVESRYLMQRINTHVFRDPVGLMDNVRRVTEHLRTKSSDPDSVLALVPTETGEHRFADEHGGPWRAYQFIENAVFFNKVQNAEQARQAAGKYGEFLRDLEDLPGPRLNETIEGFHDTPARYRAFRTVLDADPHDRAGECAAEIERALAFERVTGSLIDAQRAGTVPERIIHNDTKLNNLLFDRTSGTPKCVVDLDTVMPGLVHYDFGDMVRTMTSPAAEDSNDPSEVSMRMEYFEALVEGYLEATGHILTQTEIELLPMSGLVITIETGLRFLADHLAGDEYFRVCRPGHNLDRCRVQFLLADSIADQQDEMVAAVDKYMMSTRSD